MAWEEFPHSLDQYRTASARAIWVGSRAQRGRHARREIQVFPVGPGLGLRQVPVRADAEAGNQENKYHDGQETPPVAGGMRRRRRGLIGWLARRSYPRSGRRPSETTSLVLTIIDRQLDPCGSQGRPDAAARRTSLWACSGL